MGRGSAWFRTPRIYVRHKVADPTRNPLYLITILSSGTLPHTVYTLPTNQASYQT